VIVIAIIGSGALLLARFADPDAAPLVVPQTAHDLVCRKDPSEHVYNPFRLRVLDRCITVTGVVMDIRDEADGDYHILLRLDPPFAALLRAGNMRNPGPEGNLVVEPVCERPPTQADAVSACVGVTMPTVPRPPRGTHVQVTGPYVLDLEHFNWAEIHPAWSITTIP